MPEQLKVKGSINEEQAMRAKVRCYQPKQVNKTLCARAQRTKVDRATNATWSTSSLKTLGLEKPKQQQAQWEARLSSLMQHEETSIPLV
ncbi:conserved hypothetical protein [Vibrio owensii]|uniref:hypothetical protein n=1 Tax=Vibrio owensii TaxID=696485 RepID=UPI0028945EC7|nr:conserved hypothetical protein [Vibrio owensii]CAH1585712.1 conserved hypothetical protein [Vibrio owensii]